MNKKLTLPDGQSVFEIDVPGDGNCFYTALLLSTLLPHVDSPALFLKHIRELLGDGLSNDDINQFRLILLQEYDGTAAFYRNHPILNEYVNAYLRPRLAGWVQQQRSQLSEFYSQDELSREIDNINTPTCWADDLSFSLMRRLFTTLGKRIHLYQKTAVQLTEVHTYDASSANLPQDASPVHLIFTSMQDSSNTKNHYRCLIDLTRLPDCRLRQCLNNQESSTTTYSQLNTVATSSGSDLGNNEVIKETEANNDRSGINSPKK